jgi:hypothetical protein
MHCVRRPLLLALLISLAAPSAATAQQLCKVPSAEAKAERALQEQIRQRAKYGFRSDRAYVQALVARGAILHEYEDLPGTPQEARYLKRRKLLSPGAGVTRYLRRHPGISGWWDVRDDWPRGAYVAVFLTDDSARRRATITRLAAFPESTRVVKIRYSDRLRDRVSRRIDRDYKRLGNAGFDAVETEAETGTDRVDVFVVSKRTDAARYFARRYGKLVRTHVIREDTVAACTRASAYTIAPDGLSLTVTWSDAPETPERIEVSEFADHVAVGVVAKFSVYPGFGDPGGSGVAKLGAPLGARPVLDAYDGRRLLQSGPSPGDPPCPDPPSRERTPLQSAIEERARYGMNTDPAYVQSLLDDDRTFTERERRWVKSYERIDYQSKVDDYLQHWREDWGGTSVYGQYPNPPILVIRLLRRQALHTARLKALSKYPDLLRTITSTVQRDYFYELPQIIGDRAALNDGFLDGYGRDAFYVQSADGDEGSQSVDVDVITARPDAAAYFTAQFGPLVRVNVIGDRFECRGSY